MTREKRELSAPPDVEQQGGAEILRLFVTDGALSLSMQRAFEEPQMWGQLLADLALHVAQVYARETPSKSRRRSGKSGWRWTRLSTGSSRNMRRR